MRRVGEGSRNVVSSSASREERGSSRLATGCVNGKKGVAARSGDQSLCERVRTGHEDLRILSQPRDLKGRVDSNVNSSGVFMS
jgi:hypothetical protein